MAVFKNTEGKWVASYNGTKQYFSSQADALQAYDRMKSGSSGSVAAPRPPATTQPKPLYVPPTPQPTPMGGYRPLDQSILNSVTSNLGPNMSNDPNQVKALQQALVSAGYMTSAEMMTGPGVYGPKTTAAVAKWQTQNGIPTNGSPGYFGPVSKNFIKTGSVSVTSPINASDPRNTANPIYDTSIPGGIVPPELAGTTLGLAPQEAFDLFTKNVTPGTSEYQKAFDKISTAYFDIMQQQLNAQTEQEHAIANANWQNLKNDIETTLNVTLSNDAFQAWDQLEGFRNQYNQQGIEGSGLQNEAVDDYLRKVRMNDSQARTQSTSREEQGQMEWLTKFATPEQVRDFIAQNPDKAEQWGLVPSRDIRNSLSLSALKKKYPDLSTEQLENYRSSVLDEFGNYRSNLYQRAVTGNNFTADQANVSYTTDPVTGKLIPTVTPSDFGSMDVNRARDLYQHNMVLSNALGNLKTDQDSLGTTVRPAYNESGAGSEGSQSFTGSPVYKGPITPVTNPNPRPPVTTTPKPKPITTVKPTTVKPPTTTPTTNYQLRPGETPAQYKARLGLNF